MKIAIGVSVAFVGVLLAASVSLNVYYYTFASQANRSLERASGYRVDNTSPLSFLQIEPTRQYARRIDTRVRQLESVLAVRTRDAQDLERVNVDLRRENQDLQRNNSVLRDTLAGVRAKIEAEQSKGGGVDWGEVLISLLPFLF